jgi:hypothetical protein
LAGVLGQGEKYLRANRDRKPGKSSARVSTAPT